MSRHHTSATIQNIIASLAAPPRLQTLGPIAGRFIHALRLIALHERMGRDPVPELAARLGSVEVAARALILAQTISASWPENIHVSRFCCGLLNHDEADPSAPLSMRPHRRAGGVRSGALRPDPHRPNAPPVGRRTGACCEQELRAV